MMKTCDIWVHIKEPTCSLSTAKLMTSVDSGQTGARPARQTTWLNRAFIYSRKARSGIGFSGVTFFLLYLIVLQANLRECFLTIPPKALRRNNNDGLVSGGN